MIVIFVGKIGYFRTKFSVVKPASFSVVGNANNTNNFTTSLKCHCDKIIQSIMRVFCAGFNLYGQFLNINDTCIETFKSTVYSNAIDLQISHAYLIIKTEENDHINTSQRTKINLHGFLRNVLHQNEQLNFNINDTNLQISVSDSRALFLFKGQNVFSFDYTVNSNYNLLLLPDFTVTETDQILDDNQTNVIMRIASGICMSNAFSNRGYIYNIPSRLPCKILNMKDICTGREHCLILTDDGTVFSFGGGSRGQLGHGDVDDRDTPHPIKSLEGIKIVKISCGAWHSVALSADGDLYTWGWNSNGQLGLHTNNKRTSDHISIMASPQVVDFDVNITDVACGSRHTVVLSESLKLYGCGWNKYCQLGFKSTDENHSQFVLLYDFTGFNVIGLRCGTWNTAVLVHD